MESTVLANGITAVGYLAMDVLGFLLLLGMLMWAGYKRDPYPLDNTHPHNTR